MKKTLAIANILALLLVLLVNYLANTGFINGNTMEVISDRYYNLLTPAGYAFSIWGLIYLGLIGFVGYTTYHAFSGKKEAAFLQQIGWWFVISSLANSFWVVSWLHDLLGLSLLLMTLLLFSQIKIILNTRMELDDHPWRHYLLVFWPFAIYTGWISIAYAANVAAWLTKLGWNGWGLLEHYWTIMILAVLALIHLVVLYTRNLREFNIAGIWGLVAIGIANQAIPLISYTCYGLSGLLFIAVSIHAIKRSA